MLFGIIQFCAPAKNSTLIQLAPRAASFFEKDVRQDVGVLLICLCYDMGVNIGGGADLSVAQSL